MKLPGYKDRDRVELRRALRWALKRLQMQDWTVELRLGEEVLAERGLKHGHKSTATCTFCTARLHAIVGVQDLKCIDHDEDPLLALFHELGHIVIAVGAAADPKDLHHDEWEQVCYRIALLLYMLWHVEAAA